MNIMNVPVPLLKSNIRELLPILTHMAMVKSPVSSLTTPSGSTICDLSALDNLIALRLAKEAEEALIKQKELGTIYGADNVKDLMISGERAIAMIWSGEGLNLADEYDYLEYVVPKEGANFWIDSLVIPKGTENKESAETFINFLCDTDNAYKIAEEIGYTTPNKEAMLKQPDNVKNNKGAYIPKEIMDKCEGYKYLTQDELKMYDDVWMKVKG